MASSPDRFARRPRRRAPLVLEGLETRQLLSTVIVANDNDSGAGSLRAAVASAPSGSTITFAPSADGTITLTSGPITLTNEALTIKGPGASLLTVTTGNASTAVFINDKTAANAVTISGVLFADNQQAVLSQGAVLTLASCAFRTNAAGPNSINGPIEGGAVVCDVNSAATPGGPTYPASLTLTGDTFAGNAANIGGAVYTSVYTTLTSCLFIGNRATEEYGQGGAVYDSALSAPLVIRGSTFVSNLADANGDGNGGAITSFVGAPVVASGDTFTANKAVGTDPNGGAVNLLNASRPC